MDRKAWLVITLCIAGMIFNGWWMVTHPPQPAPAPPAPAAGAASVTASAAAAAATAPGVPAVSPVPATTEKTVELKNDEVAYTFTTKGGGIAHAVMLTTKDLVKLNERGKAAIGSLSSAAKSYDDLSYAIVEQTNSRIVFEAESPDKVLIRKEYSFSEGSGSNDHLLNFKLTLTNRGPAKLTRDTYYLYTGAAASLRPDEVEPPAFCWNNAGDASNQATSSFREGAGFLGFGGPVLDLKEKFRNPDRLRWA
ncbi:MAG: rane protein insertase YidC, partial [Verrucomicrobiota bacterium]